MRPKLLEAPKKPVVHDVVIGVAERIAERGPDAAMQNYTELHLVIDHQRAEAARTLAEALGAEFNGNEMVTRRIGSVLNSFLEVEADYDAPEAA
jgi:hypothetical protein